VWDAESESNTPRVVDAVERTTGGVVPNVSTHVFVLVCFDGDADYLEPLFYEESGSDT
jgi:hypothetical protein